MDVILIFPMVREKYLLKSINGRDQMAGDISSGLLDVICGAHWILL